MRLKAQISQATLVALGHFNPLIFRPDWLREKELIVGTDSEELQIDVIHAELVMLRFPWGRLQCDHNQFLIATDQEPTIAACDFFVKCFQMLPETPINAVGINREIHFSAGSLTMLQKVADTVAPKSFWEPLLWDGDKRIGGLRSLVMEQAIVEKNVKFRADGHPGHVQFKVEPSLRQDVPFGVFTQINDHFDLNTAGRLSNGRYVSELVDKSWISSMQRSENWFDYLMSIVDDRAD
jgi:hypothetical protein